MIRNVNIIGLCLKPWKYVSPKPCHPKPRVVSQYRIKSLRDIALQGKGGFIGLQAW